VVFAANLIVPLHWAWDITREGGRIGMACALFGWWVVGALTCVRPGPGRAALVLGGAFIALSQLYPVLQLFAGMVGLCAAAAPAGEEHWSLISMGLSETSGFAATVVTGALLLFFALCSGCAVLGTAGSLRTPEEEAGRGPA
jgi:hypothetical protein